MNDLTVTGVAKIAERMDSSWVGIVIPGVTLLISIIVIWVVYNYFKQS